MKHVGSLFARADVRAIYLVHGTFVGADVLGLLREVARVSPETAVPLRRLHKQALDAITHDAGNYTPEYATAFEEALNDSGTPLPVRLFHWSGENVHIGRADGAVRLLYELSTQEKLRGGRVLLWGHSHGGNLFALMTNLLANDQGTNARFFRASRSYYRWPHSGKTDMPVWEHVRKMLNRDKSPLSEVLLDVVTLGTPVRYGWDSDGYASLLHFVNHHPAKGLAEYQALFPPSIDDVLSGRGDTIQQLGIAGTNLALPFWAWRAWLAELRLGRLIQPKIRKRDTLSRLKLGIRAHQEGETLLVDYGPGQGHVGRHVAGHAVYTRRSWLLFHAEQVAQRLYGDAFA
jgi:hypothetical protein